MVLTANALKSDAERFIAAGMNDYLTKPFDEGKLFQKISANRVKSPKNFSNPNPIITTLNTVITTSKFTPAICNLTMLQAMANGKNDFLIKFFELFIQQVPPQVMAMQEAASQNDWAAVTGLAHQLKSNFDTLGITSLQQPIRDVENFARQQSNLAIIPDSITTIRSTMEQAILELRAEMARLQN